MGRSAVLAVGLGIGVLAHGLLDVAPHSYPLPSVPDVAIALAIFVVSVVLAKREQHLLVLACFAGAALADLVDLGPEITNRHLGMRLPVVQVFPWHWHQYSGSIYDGSRWVQSLIAHFAVVGVSLVLLWRYRRSLFFVEG